MEQEHKEILEVVAEVFELVKNKKVQDVSILIIALVPTNDDDESNMAIGMTGTNKSIAVLIDTLLTDYPEILEQLMLRKIGDMMASDFRGRLNNLVALSGTLNKMPA